MMEILKVEFISFKEDITTRMKETFDKISMETKDAVDQVTNQQVQFVYEMQNDTKRQTSQNKITMANIESQLSNFFSRQNNVNQTIHEGMLTERKKLSEYLSKKKKQTSKSFVASPMNDT